MKLLKVIENGKCEFCDLHFPKDDLNWFAFFVALHDGGLFVEIELPNGVTGDQWTNEGNRNRARYSIGIYQRKKIRALWLSSRHDLGLVSLNPMKYASQANGIPVAPATAGAMQ